MRIFILKCVCVLKSGSSENIGGFDYIVSIFIILGNISRVFVWEYVYGKS